MVHIKRTFIPVIFFAGVLAFAHAASSPRAASHPHVLMISIDGMRPDYVTKADEHHLKIPVLRSFLANGTYADGVIGVLPTLTYPSHTTLVTGVWPIEHGIVNNTTFDPFHEHPGAWYWYFNAIKAETLYQAADKAGLTTAAVSWPVTVGAPIDYLLAESPQSEITDTPNGPLVHPADLKEKLGITLPPDNTALDKVAAKDNKVTAWSVGIIEKYNPNLVLVHISALDHEEHKHGPFSDEADQTLETIDTQVGQIVAAERKMNPNAKILIVSDHGFVRVDHAVNVNVLFVQAGLITLKAGKQPKHTSPVASWDVATWLDGGTVSIVLRNPEDKAVMAKVQALLDKMKGDPQYGVNGILTHDEIVKEGGDPETAFMIDFKPGWAAVGKYTGLVVEPPSTTHGTHGYLPSYPELRSTFMVDGTGVAKHRDLGIIDMRQIAPTVARMLDISLPAAKLKPVQYKP